MYFAPQSRKSKTIKSERHFFQISRLNKNSTNLSIHKKSRQNKILRDKLINLSPGLTIIGKRGDCINKFRKYSLSWHNRNYLTWFFVTLLTSLHCVICQRPEANFQLLVVLLISRAKFSDFQWKSQKHRQLLYGLEKTYPVAIIIQLSHDLSQRRLLTNWRTFDCRPFLRPKSLIAPGQEARHQCQKLKMHPAICTSQ